MTKNIYVSGCSHVQGHGFPDNTIGGPWHSKFTWPAVIERELDCNVVNFSYAGNSTDNVVKDFLSYPDKETLDAIVILFPYSGRFLLRDQRGEIENFWIHRLESYAKHKQFYKALKYYFSFLHDQSIVDQHFISGISLIEFFAKKHDIPFYFGVTTDEDKSLVENTLGYTDVFDWYGWCRKKKFNLLPDNSHFDGKAHKTFAKIIKKWLESKGFENKPL